MSTPGAGNYTNLFRCGRPYSMAHRRTDCVGLLKAKTGSICSSRESLNRRAAMSVFTPAEITYLQSQRLARVATSGPGGQPHVVPVSFRYNPDEDTIDVGGHGFRNARCT